MESGSKSFFIFFMEKAGMKKEHSVAKNGKDGMLGKERG